ncbi:MAG: MFS transporter [Rhodanobacteraceae bacterium]|nr:MAG: MFS transporter [Rhodanobacteraceae bacterium]
MSHPALADHPRRHAAVIFVFVTVLIDLLSFGIIIPVLPHLIVDLVGGSISRAAVWASGFGTAFMLMQFLCSPIQGALSDRFGRRTVILISCCGLGADFIVMALAPALWILFIGRILSGAASASYTTANAYIADITPREKRAAAFGLLGAAFAIGFLVGPALGGVLGHVWIRLPFWVAAGLSLTNFVYGLLILPESLPPERRSPRLEWKHANPVGALVLLQRYPQVLALAAVFFLMALAQFSLNGTFVLYTDYRFGWGPLTVGLALALVGLCTGIVQGGLVRPLLPRFGERGLMLIGLGCAAIGYLCFGLAPQAWLFWLGIPILCLGGLASPPAQSVMTGQVDAAEQGRLQGALTSVRSLAGIIAPLIFANLFALFISQHAPLQPARNYSGVSFVLAALLSLAALVLAARATRGMRKSTPDATPVAPAPGNPI